MPTFSEATPHQLLPDILLSQKPGLCSPCQQVDLKPLFRPIASESSQSSAEDLAEARAVYLEQFSLSHVLQYKNCGLCTALAKCAVLSGLPTETSDSLRHVRCCVRPKIVWISDPAIQETNESPTKASLSGQLHVWFYEMKTRQKIARPDPLPGSSGRTTLSLARRLKKLRSRAPAASNDLPDPSATDLETLPDQQEDGAMPNHSADTRPSNSSTNATPIQPDAGVRQLTLKSAVASWTLDVVDSHRRGLDQTRSPLTSHMDTELCRTWLEECVETHDHPTTIAGISTPLSQLPLSTCLRAIHTTTGQLSPLDPNEKFVALTYTWGKAATPLSAFVQLASTGSGEHRRLSSFPPTIRDAIILARDLGFKWLWVDRVCIEQSNTAEKALLIPYMKDIFAAAQLTIVASSGSDANRGLPGTGNTKRNAENPSFIPQSDRNLEVLPTPISFNAMLQQSTWRTRGWCFEEHIFSRRLLYVFPSEIFFSCAKGTFRESSGRTFSTDIAGSTWGDRGRTPPTIAGELHAKFHRSAADADRRITLRQFVRSVEEYTSRGLSFEEDRIKAFAGLITVADSAQNAVTNEPLLLHGHPLRFFETLLTWHNEGDQVHRKPSNGCKMSPSWSWASAGTKVYFLDNGEEHTRSHWFRYSVLGGFDILGLPATESIPFVSNLDLTSPQQILDKKPWLNDMPQLPPPYQKLVGSDTIAAQNKAPRLPVLHLVTVIFKALLAPLSEGQHCMRPLNSDSTTRTRVTGRWSSTLEYNNIAKRASERKAEGSDLDEVFLQGPIEIGEARAHSFALVGGFNHMYIMLLKPADGYHTFSRAGLLRLSLYGSTSVSIIPIMSKGAASWEYIRLE